MDTQAAFGRRRSAAWPSMSTLYHNPRCSKSRAALDLLRGLGVEPDIRDYLHEPPSIAEFRELLGKLGIGPRSLLRTGEAEYAELGLDDPAVDEATLLAAMHAHPQLMERPIFVTATKAVIARPPERVLDILDDD